MNKVTITEEHKKLNKYNLRLNDLNKLIVKDFDKLTKCDFFWYNKAIDKYVSTEISTEISAKYCSENDYTIIATKNKIKVSLSSFGGMCHYNFRKFFDEKDIENNDDLQIQVKLINRINYLIDNGILGLK